MFKLCIVLAILAIVSARPGLLHHGSHQLVKTTIVQSAPVFHEKHVLQKAIISEPTHIAVEEPYLTKIGEHVEKIPTSFSHQYRTDVHSKALVKDIIVPVVKNYLTPVVKHVEITPVVKHIEVQPIVKHVEVVEEPQIVKEQEIHISHQSSGVAALSIANSHGIVEAPVEVYGPPKVSAKADAFAKIEIKEPIVHAEATAVIDGHHKIPFTSYEAPLGPVISTSKVSAIAEVPSNEYGLPHLTSSAKAEAFATASISAPYPAQI